MNIFGKISLTSAIEKIKDAKRLLNNDLQVDMQNLKTELKEVWCDLYERYIGLNEVLSVYLQEKVTQYDILSRIEAKTNNVEVLEAYAKIYEPICCEFLEETSGRIRKIHDMIREFKEYDEILKDEVPQMQTVIDRSHEVIDKVFFLNDKLKTLKPLAEKFASQITEEDDEEENDELECD